VTQPVTGFTSPQRGEEICGSEFRVRGLRAIEGA
jgi:hypothetical protein